MDTKALEAMHEKSSDGLSEYTPYRNVPDNSLKRSKAVVPRLNMHTEAGDAMCFVKVSSVELTRNGAIANYSLPKTIFGRVLMDKLQVTACLWLMLIFEI